MKKKFKLITLGFCSAFLLNFITGCSSLGVATSGANYFNGKKEADLVKYFKYDGESVRTDGDYDKVLRFSNLVTTMYVDKTITEKFKNRRYSTISKLYYHELWDGCLIYPGQVVHRSFVNGQLASHQNNNNAINNELKRFEADVRNLGAVPKNSDNVMFNKSSIGSTYYIYDIYRHGFNLDDNGDKTTAYECTYTIQSVSVYEDSKSSTETHIAYIYNDRENTYTDEKGNQISKSDALSNEKAYIAKGFESRRKNKGVSLVAYIKDGVVVKVDSAE